MVIPIESMSQVCMQLNLEGFSGGYPVGWSSSPAVDFYSKYGNWSKFIATENTGHKFFTPNGGE